MKTLVPIFALMLCSCANQADPTIKYLSSGVVVKTIEVPVIKVQKCIDKRDIPVAPEALGKRPEGISQALDIAVAKVFEYQKYAMKSDVLLKGCASD